MPASQSRVTRSEAPVQRKHLAVGRTGALAVALGIGVAVFSQGGVAHATPAGESPTPAAADGPASGTAEHDATHGLPDLHRLLTHLGPNPNGQSGPFGRHEPSETTPANALPIPHSERTVPRVRTPLQQRPLRATLNTTRSRAANAPRDNSNIATVVNSAISNAAGTQAIYSVAEGVPAPNPAPARRVDPISTILVPLRAFATGLSNVLAPGNAPAGSPAPYALLAFVRREFDRSLFNQSPTVSTDPIATSVSEAKVITGRVPVIDPDGDPLRYDVVTGPTKGTVIVNPNTGRFDYTPGAELVATGGTDTFTVSGTETNASDHLHGPILGILAAVFGGDRGNTATATVTVHVAPPLASGVPGTYGVITRTIDVGNLEGSVAVLPDGSAFYVTTNDGTVVQVQPGTGTQTPIPGVSSQFHGMNQDVVPYNLAISADGSTLYVANGNDVPGTVSVVKIPYNSANTVTNVELYSDLFVTPTITQLTVSPDGSYLYGTSDNSGLSQLDIATGKRKSLLQTAGTDDLDGVAISPDGNTAYVLYGSELVVTDLTTSKHTTYSYHDGSAPPGTHIASAVSPDGTKLYITDAAQNAVVVVNTASVPADGRGAKDVTGAIINATDPRDVVVSPDGTKAYVVNGDSVMVIDTATNNVLQTIDVPDGARRIALTGDGGFGYVTGKDKVTEIKFTLAPTVAGPPTVGAPNPVTGEVDGSFRVTDNVPMNYGVSTNPTKGVAVVNADSTFTYTPSAQARLDAYLTPGDDTDTFTAAFYNNADPPVLITVTVPIDPAPAGVTDTIAVGSSPRAVVYSADGSRAYVVTSGTDSLTVIDTATNAVSGSPIGVGDAPNAVALNPAGNTAYVTNFFDDTVSIIDTNTGQVTATIAAGQRPAGIVHSTSGPPLIYVSNSADHSVTIIDTNTKSILDTVNVGDQPGAIAITPQGSHVYVVNAGSDTVSVIDTGSFGVTTIGVGGGPQGLAINPAGNRVYVTNSDDGTVSVIDTTTHTVTPITVGDAPEGIAVSADGTRVYVTNRLSGTLSIIDTATNTVIATVPAGDSPIAVSVSPDGKRAYVVNDGAAADTVSVVTIL